MLNKTIKTLAATAAIYTGLALAPAPAAQAATPRITHHQAVQVTTYLLRRSDAPLADLLDAPKRGGVRVTCGKAAARVTCRFAVRGARQIVHGTVEVWADDAANYGVRIVRLSVTDRRAGR